MLSDNPPRRGQPGPGSALWALPFRSSTVRNIKLPTTTYALLGLLAKRPLSGYELGAFADRSIAHFWPVPHSQVYSEVARLENLGYVTGAAVAQERRPDKRVFTATTAGRDALRAWLEEPGHQAYRAKNGMLVKLFFAAEMSPERLQALLSEFRFEAVARARDLEAIVDRLSTVPSARFGRLIALFGQRRAEAELAWLDEVEAMLATAPTSERHEGVQT